MNLEDYKSTYHPSWLEDTIFTIISENDNWMLIKRIHPKKHGLNSQRILFNKIDGHYFTWQRINKNLHHNKFKRFDGVIRANEPPKWLGHRIFGYYEKDIPTILKKIMVTCL